MKRITFLLVVLIMTITSHAQTKKVAAKNPAPKSVAKKTAEPVSPLNASDAGKYAKDFANKMYYTDPIYGDKSRGLNVSINDWKSWDDSEGKWWYFIKLNLTWQEGTGGWGDWKNVSYKGTLITDQFGCNVIYLIDEKSEPSILGILKRARSLTEEQREILSQKDDWTANVQYYYEPSGCLNN